MPDPAPASESTGRLERQRWRLVVQIRRLTEKPLIVLSLVWLVLIVVEFARGLSRPLDLASQAIWALFAADFALGLLIAPRRGLYLRRNLLAALSLAVPALRALRLVRAFRVVRAARAARSFRLLRLVSSVNRGLRAIGRALGHRGLGYVLASLVVVTLAGAAAMSRLESREALRDAGLPAGPGLDSFGEALWWTSMIMTTMGSAYWPQTAEGRLVCWLLSVYAFVVFGYVTATLASHFVGRDARRERAAAEPVARQIEELRSAVEALREEGRAGGR